MRERYFSSYPRAYRYLKGNRSGVLYAGAVLVLCLCIFMKEITGVVCNIAILLLKPIINRKDIHVIQDKIFFIKYKYISIPTNLPSFSYICINIVLYILLFFIIKKYLRNVTIRISICSCLALHIIICVFFFFSVDYSVMTSEYLSKILMLQEMGIWIFTLIMCGLILYVMPGVILKRILYFAGIFSITIYFSVFKYAMILGITEKCSILYGGILFLYIGTLPNILWLSAFIGSYADSVIGKEDVYKC